MKWLPRLITEKNKMTQITKSEMKREELLTLWNKKDKKYYEQLHTLDNLDEMDKFLERIKLSKLIQEEVENQNKTITTIKIEFVI